MILRVRNLVVPLLVVLLVIWLALHLGPLQLRVINPHIRMHIHDSDEKSTGPMVLPSEPLELQEGSNFAGFLCKGTSHQSECASVPNASDS